jgi:hypothetical protein
MPIQGGTYQNFSIVQGPCNIPASAGAYLLNIAVVPTAHLSYLTVYPAGDNRGLVTTMNSPDGRVKAQAVIVAAGTNEEVSIYASDTTNVIIDVYGYFAAGSGLAYYPLTPCRVVDTRGPDGPLGGPLLQAGQERDFPFPESQCIPSDINVVAYSINVTALPTSGSLPYLTVWPVGNPQPFLATLVDYTGTVVSNAAVIPAGTNGAIAVYPEANTNLVIDINGFFAAPGGGGLLLYATAPCHAFDSRVAALGFTGEKIIPILNAPGRPCIAAHDAQALVLNATVYPQGALEYLTLWADGEMQPITWTLNAVDGAVASNLAIVGNLDGSIDAHASGRTQMTLDTYGYFAP